MPRIIMHLDMDAFYAAVEQREHPEWRGKPVVVGADPKGGKGRGVAMTASYEARKFGIRSAMPISKAYKLCPTAIFTPPNFPLYMAASKGVMSTLRSYSDKFEQVSIDEAFIDITEKAGSGGNGESEKLAAAIKNEIWEKEKLSCSIGVGSNKLVAKMASDFRKPDGLTMVDFGKEKEFLAPLPVRKLIGVGEKTEAVLHGMGVDTIGKLAELPLGFMQKEFGKYGLYLHKSANGIDASEVEENYEIKSINRNYTFEEDTKDKQVIFAAIDEMMEDAHGAMMQNKFGCKTIGIRARFEDFETHTREKTLSEPTTDLALIGATAKKLLQPFLGDKRKMRQVGVRLAHLEVKTGSQKLVSEFFNR